MRGPHPSHVTRFSDASTFDEICIHCGAHDEVPGGWGRLAEPCPKRCEKIVINGDMFEVPWDGYLAILASSQKDLTRYDPDNTDWVKVTEWVEIHGRPVPPKTP